MPTARPEGLAETLRLEGVVELDVLTNNQLRPVLVEMATEKARFVPSVLVTATCWNEDTAEPAVAENVRLLGLTTKSAVLLTTSVTAIV